MTARIEQWRIAGAFTISRGAKTEAVVVVAEISRGGVTGRGECVPYARYGETPEATLAAILAMQDRFAAGLGRDALQSAMPAGAARNAVDCALLDLEAKSQGQRVWDMLQRPAPRACTTAYTISLGTPEAMASATAKAAYRPLLKIKLGSDDDISRITAVRQAAPESELIVDANEAWTPDNLKANLDACHNAGVTLIEQPLPAGKDDALMHVHRPIMVCADESVHGLASLEALRGRYDAINIKLDKAGGLTAALELAQEARRRGLDVMTGCMICSSLSIAPALMIAVDSVFADLDGPLWLAQDRVGGVSCVGGAISAPQRGFWGDS
jgi:L-alanine-DL-glutamate epimerase-like enolase superfamily enzyme